VEVPRLPPGQLGAPEDQAGEGNAEVRARVVAARGRAMERAGKPNSALSTAEVNRYCRPDQGGRQMLELAMARLGLSARAYHRVLKVARTIADLAGAEAIAAAHLGEAVGYRRLDRTVPQA
jgi:magnesium chelatase family protein